MRSVLDFLAFVVVKLHLVNPVFKGHFRVKEVIPAGGLSVNFQNSMNVH